MQVSCGPVNAEQPMETQPIKILLVEDDQVFVNVLQQGVATLLESPFEFCRAETVAQAQAQLSTRRFDALVLDLSLPDSQGLETFTRIHLAIPSTPIIVLTGADDDALALAAVREGAQDYLVKGQVNPRMLVQVIRYAIERKRGEESLREREEFFRLISESMTDLIAVVDRNGRRLYNSPSYRALLGNPEELVGKDSFEEIHPEDRERIREVFRTTVQTGMGQRAEYRFLLKNGMIRHVESQGSVIHDVTGAVSKVVVISRDITERRQAEERLRTSEALYHSLVESLPQNIFRKDAQGRFTFVSQQFCSTLGLKPAEVLGKTDSDFFPPELAQKYQADDQKVMQSRKILETVEEHCAPGHEKTHVQVVKIPIYDDAGKCMGIQGIYWDITERRRHEEALRASEERLQAFLDNSAAVIYMKTTDGRYILVNRAFETLFQVQREALAGKTDYDLFPRSMADGFRANDLKVVESNAPVQSEETVLEGGRTHTFLSVKFPLRDSAGVTYAVCGISTDITGRKQAEARLEQINEDLSRSQKALLKALGDLRKSHEELKAAQLQLIQAEKMDSVGALAAGVAHEVKNPLQTILMGVRFLSKAVQIPDENVNMVLSDMRAAVVRADGIVKGLLEFSAPRELVLSSEDINTIIEQSLRMVNYDLTDHRIDLIKELAPHLPALKLDRPKMEQVFINLFMNAIHAMQGGGTLTIRTQVRWLQRGEIDHAVEEEEPDPYRTGQMVVATEIEDTGHGIPEDKLVKVFDPFFTTKPVGQGTGLGLTVVKRIVEMNGGVIEIRNRPEAGVRVSILFKPSGR